MRFSNSNKADNNLGQAKIKKENYLELNFIARILWRFLKISTLLIVARQLLKRRRHSSQFLGETKRISENARKQPIILLGLLKT